MKVLKMLMLREVSIFDGSYWQRPYPAPAIALLGDNNF
jgi:hypothetical protein